MLVLSRNEEEVIRLYTSDGVITLIALRCENGRVRLGFDAPLEVQIVRGEVPLEPLNA